jgi:hypothetical protein
MPKMTKLQAFKGRERGQNNRRKREAVEAAIDKVADSIRQDGWTNDMAKQAARRDFNHFRFPRL